jgi:hypothetical protein
MYMLHTNLSDHAACIVEAMRGIEYSEYSQQRYHRSVTANQAKTFLLRCTPKLLRSISSGQRMNDVYDLLADTDSTIGHQFDSINEIQRVHDERTERETEKLMKSCEGKSYIYTDEFLSIIKEHGFFMPLGPVSLVERGKQHKNCVGTYDNKHVSNAVNNNKVMRLVFSRTATIEVNIEIQHEKIVAVTIGQCKGMHNKDQPYTEELSALRIALTGQSYQILVIEKKEV